MGRSRKARAVEGALVAAVDGKVVGPLLVAGLPVTIEDCFLLTQIVWTARQARDLPRMRRVGRPRQKALAYLAWRVALWTATKMSDGEPHWPAVAAFARTTGLDHGRESLVCAGERLRKLAYRMIRDVEGTSLAGRNSRNEFRPGIATRR